MDETWLKVARQSFLSMRGDYDTESLALVMWAILEHLALESVPVTSNEDETIPTKRPESGSGESASGEAHLRAHQRTLSRLEAVEALLEQVAPTGQETIQSEPTSLPQSGQEPSAYDGLSQKEWQQRLALLAREAGFKSTLFMRGDSYVLEVTALPSTPWLIPWLPMKSGESQDGDRGLQPQVANNASSSPPEVSSV